MTTGPQPTEKLDQLPTLSPPPALDELVLRRALSEYECQSRPRAAFPHTRVPAAEWALYAVSFTAYLVQIARLAVHLVSR